MPQLQESYRAVIKTGGVLDLSTARAHFDLTGPDRFRYLNGQITNRVSEDASPRMTYGCALTAKGRMSGDLYYFSGDDALHIDTAIDNREAMAQRLERYLIADDAELKDATECRALIHLYHVEKPPPLAVPLLATRPSNRLGREGWDLFIAPADASAVLAELEKNLPNIDEELAEVLRIEAGFARWGRELDDETIPMEAGLAERGIDFEKGCYLGQEIISRIKSIGAPGRFLVRLHPSSEAIPQPGEPLFAGDGDRPVGRITSAAFSFALDKPLALGYVKKGFEQPGTVLREESGGVRFEVQPLSNL